MSKQEPSNPRRDWIVATARELERQERIVTGIRNLEDQAHKNTRPNDSYSKRAADVVANMPDADAIVLMGYAMKNATAAVERLAASVDPSNPPRPATAVAKSSPSSASDICICGHAAHEHASDPSTGGIGFCMMGGCDDCEGFKLAPVAKVKGKLAVGVEWEWHENIGNLPIGKRVLAEVRGQHIPPTSDFYTFGEFSGHRVFVPDRLPVDEREGISTSRIIRWCIPTPSN